jgi:hypothetical protein
MAQSIPAEVYDRDHSSGSEGPVRLLCGNDLYGLGRPT